MHGVVRSVGALAKADEPARMALLGELEAFIATRHAITRSQQILAWSRGVALLSDLSQTLVRGARAASDWTWALEYVIPRLRTRPDAVLIAGRIVFVIEFKFGSNSFSAADVWQAERYALDLRDFHAESRDRTVIPILVATEAPEVEGGRPREGFSIPVHAVAPGQLASLILKHAATEPASDSKLWIESEYRPTPTIIEAAQWIFANHDVREIGDARADNLSVTVDAIKEAVEHARRARCHVVCFVTGVPGAGKTLAGLHAVHHASREVGASAAFLSGNGPLIQILREALARTVRGPRQPARRTVGSLIQGVHEFLQASRRSMNPPAEHVIVFDEAQRAWTAERMLQKEHIAKSEPDLMLEALERHPEWAVLICLVGAGQEINDGEAGLSEWSSALANHGRWQVRAAPVALEGGEGLAGHALSVSGHRVTRDKRLHLGVSVRSPRAKAIAAWVDFVLSRDAPSARQALADMRQFPVAISRDLETVRAWLRARKDPYDRAGLVASSSAQRLRAEGIEVTTAFQHSFRFQNWFLDTLPDVRSSDKLEVAATEFRCQGLELDWVGVLWGGDLITHPQGRQWLPRRFVADRWQVRRSDERRRHSLNIYRVLLTRARKGLIIFVPEGAPDDPTLDPLPLDATYDFLVEAGAIPVVDPSAWP